MKKSYLTFTPTRAPEFFEGVKASESEWKYSIVSLQNFHSKSGMQVKAHLLSLLKKLESKALIINMK